MGDLVYDLALLIWPTQPLAVVEVSTGPFIAIALSVGANVLLFGVAGVIVGIIARQPVPVIVSYLVTCAFVLVLALWSAGFSLQYLNAIALIVAFILYAVPFLAVLWLNRSSKI